MDPDPDPDLNLAYFHHSSPPLSHLIFYPSTLTPTSLTPPPSSLLLHTSTLLPHTSSVFPYPSTLLLTSPSSSLTIPSSSLLLYLSWYCELSSQYQVVGIEDRIKLYPCSQYQMVGMQIRWWASKVHLHIITVSGDIKLPRTQLGTSVDVVIIVKKLLEL